jgi:hypothetical protein
MCCWLGWDLSNLIFPQNASIARLAISVGLGVLAVTLAIVSEAIIKDED